MIMKKITIGLILAVLLLSATGCSNTTKTVTSSKVAVVNEQTISGEVTISGILDAESSANLTAQVPGTVVSVLAKEGTFVEKDAVILSLDKRDLQIQLEQAQANLQKSIEAMNQAKISLHDAEKELERNNELIKIDAISQKDLEQSISKRDMAFSQYETQKTGVSSAQNAVKLIELNISKADIKSPFSGVVATCSVSPGETVSLGSPVASVVSVDNLVLNGNVSETVVNSVKQGQKANVQSDVIPGKSFAGEIIFLSPISITTGQFFPVKIKITNSERILRAGMTGIAKINVEQKTLTIPKTAVFQQSGRDYVYLVKEDKAVKQSIKTGISDSQFMSVLSGLSLNDKVISEGTDRILEGDLIKEAAN
ncbi:MAG: efflux RND transporter periplasmic adaptor subunit [Peptococcaceae bacterium]|nr:efflux RND transporter periplasmic adaptor subunit [Peptococcaceae bacterium]